MLFALACALSAGCATTAHAPAPEAESATSPRSYPVSNRFTMTLHPPTTWQEKTRIVHQGTHVAYRRASGDPRLSVQITAAPIDPSTFDLRTAAERALTVIEDAGARSDGLKEIAGEGVRGFWFWAEDPNADPNDPKDYPYLAQVIARAGDLAVSATLLTHDGGERNRTAFLDLMKTLSVEP